MPDDAEVFIPYPWHCTVCAEAGEIQVSSRATILEGCAAILAAHALASPTCLGGMETVRLGKKGEPADV